MVVKLLLRLRRGNEEIRPGHVALGSAHVLLPFLYLW